MNCDKNNKIILSFYNFEIRHGNFLNFFIAKICRMFSYSYLDFSCNINTKVIKLLIVEILEREGGQK